MNELSWHDRGRLWLRIGLRAVMALIAGWACVRLGPPLVSLFAPFLLAFLVAWALSPAAGWLHERLGVSRRLLSLVLLLLAFALLAALVWGLLAGMAREIFSLTGDWESMVASLQGVMDQLGTTFARGMERLPAGAREAVDSLVEQLFQWLETVIPRFLSGAVDTVTDLARGLPSFAVAAVVFLMASYFLTADYPRLRSSLAQRLPQGPRQLASLIKRAAAAGFGGYVKAEVILSIGVFFILLGGFLLIRQPYALLLAFALAVLDFIPILGSGDRKSVV